MILEVLEILEILDILEILEIPGKALAILRRTLRRATGDSTMMMKMKIKTLLIPLFTLMTLTMCAQEKNLFTLEELNFGGKRYQALQPENRWYAWWGDELVRID